VLTHDQSYLQILRYLRYLQVETFLGTSPFWELRLCQFHLWKLGVCAASELNSSSGNLPKLQKPATSWFDTFTLDSNLLWLKTLSFSSVYCLSIFVILLSLNRHRHATDINKHMTSTQAGSNYINYNMIQLIRLPPLFLACFAYILPVGPCSAVLKSHSC